MHFKTAFVFNYWQRKEQLWLCKTTVLASCQARHNSFDTHLSNMATASSLAEAPEKPHSQNIPFFHDDETSSISHSDITTDSSRNDSLLDKHRFFRKKDSLKSKDGAHGMTNLTNFMSMWSCFKASSERNCLPYDEILTGNDPFMSLSPYRIGCDVSYSNLIALLLNSVRREMADMWVYILPSLIERSVNGLSREECIEFQAWWSGFAEHVFIVLMTVSKMIDKMHEDALGALKRLQKEKRRDLLREYNRCVERLLVTSEIPMKAMQKKVQKLVEGRSTRELLAVDEMWSCLSSFILQTLDDSLSVARSVELKAHIFMPTGFQEKILQGMLNPPRHVRSADTAEFVSNIIISLVRWMRDDIVVMQFVNRFFTQRIAREMDTHIVRYAHRRQICMFQFARKPSSEPRKIGHKPSKVTFSLS